MQRTCPICGQWLEAHADPQMAECGLRLIERDYGFGSSKDFTWECPECCGDVADHDDARLAHCSRMLVLGDYDNGVYAG